MRAPLAYLAAVAVAVGTGGGAAAWAAGLGLTTQRLAVAASIPTPSFYPSSLTIANGGKVAGLAESGDTLTVGFSAAPDPATLCPSTWPAKTQSVNATVTINNNSGGTGDDTLTVGAVAAGKCGAGFNFGTVDLGSPGYVTTASVSFTGSTIALSSATLTITLGTAPKGSPLGTVTSGNPAVYSPAAAITDSSTPAASAAPNTASTASTVQF